MTPRQLPTTCRLVMVETAQELTRRLDVGRVSGVEGYKNVGVRDLAPNNSAEPLNAMNSQRTVLSPACNVEGHSTPKGARISGTLRVPVVGIDGKPLMPTTPQRARRLLVNGLAEKHWNKLGQFYIQLLKPTNTTMQSICLTVDPGSKWDGIALVSNRQVLTCGMLILPNGIVERLEKRRVSRKIRHHRNNLARRAWRSSNRPIPEGWLAPSQKAKVDFRIRIINELYRLYPVTNFAVEDVCFKWLRNKHVSTVELGKTKLYNYLCELGPLVLYRGSQTATLRAQLRLPKTNRKNSLTWDSHAVDAIAIGCAQMSCKNPMPPEFWGWRRLRSIRRQLHSRQPAAGGIRRRRGGSWIIAPFKKGDVIQWHDNLARVVGFSETRGLSLQHYTLDNVRFNRSANPKKCRRLFNEQILHKRMVPSFQSPVEHVNMMGVSTLG